MVNGIPTSQYSQPVGPFLPGKERGGWIEPKYFAAGGRLLEPR